MKILRNVLLMIVPILLMINIYRFVFYNNDYTFRGFAYLHQYISSFPGLSGTFNILNYLQSTATRFSNIEVTDLLTLFEAINNFFEMVGLAFSLPIMVVVDIVRDILWVLNMFTTN